MHRFLSLTVLLVWIGLGCTAAAEPAEIHVYKTPSCGCCNGWIDHLRANGFSVRATDVRNLTPIKRSNGIPPELASCHTALVDGYVVEGHVPAEDVRRMLEKKPAIAGLAVPGMPIGSPGMEGPHPQRYRVLSFGGGQVDVFAEHGPAGIE